MDDEQTPAAPARPLLARTEESPRPKGSEKQMGPGAKHHATPGALHTADEDDPAGGAESKAAAELESEMAG